MVRTLSPEKRTTILKAARVILLRDGYSAAKMSDIAAEAGVAPGTLYLYFVNKEALAHGLGDELLDRLFTQYLKVIKKLDTLEGVNGMLDWALKIGKQEREIFAMMKQSKPDPKAPLQVHLKFVTALAENLRAFMAQGTIRTYEDPADLAEVILAILHRVFMSCAHFEDRAPEHVKVAAVAVLEHALFEDNVLKKLKAHRAN